MAGKDLKAIRAMGDSPDFDDAIFGFHAQQAIEKALKAWIVLLDVEYPLTHNLSILLGLIDEHGADVSKFWGLARYTSFAVQFRYEQSEPSGTSLNRADAVREAAEILDHVERLIG
ncbi:MAG: HEPN domain-containing protein [Planctomycetes bacterium]|nr:HEPN domain-containing protein [Planctomycetota bacterium]